MKRILLIEDEKSIREVLKLNLELEKYEVTVAEDGLEAIQKIEDAYYDIIVLDLMLPKVNGIEVLEKIRLKNIETPVIIVSAKDTSTDRITGLKTGADDYLVKPFEFEELLLRIQKLLERSNPAPNVIELSEFKFGKNSINFKTFTGKHGDQTFQLSQKEVQILKYLITKKNVVVARQDILKSVWGYDVFPSTRTIDNFIAALRKHFEDNPKNPEYIHSIRGIGYKFSYDE